MAIKISNGNRGDISIDEDGDNLVAKAIDRTELIQGTDSIEAFGN